jgi:outer membrane protein OmpA-like peptidoglycan-associated protein
MNLTKAIITNSLLFLLVVAPLAQTRSVHPTSQTTAGRATLAIKYPEGDGTSIDMVGTALSPRVRGRAYVKRAAARTRVKLEITNLDHPQSLGSYYTTYLLWAIAPEGQADIMGEIPATVIGHELEVTTPYQTFGLIITAEPHAMVKLPSPAIVAENALRKNTKGGLTASRIEYRADTGSLYAVSDGGGPDYNTPLSVLGARRAVDIARRAGAREYADTELREAEVRLAALERIWPRNINKEKRFRGEAQDVMRLAEQARALAVERLEQARLAAERRDADRTIALAQSEANRAKDEAEQARNEAANYRQALARSESELMQARQRVEQAQTEAERAKANEELARIQAEHARLEAEQARRERDEAQQRLFISLSEILETRREARGLIVSLSDVLFDFDRATLKPGAREKLSKLAGILQAYPGQYWMEIEGHTDAIGSDQYNVRLSEARAYSVRDYLVQAGIAQNRIVAIRGFGKTRPVATNDTPEGRQMNRRVEIVIADDETRGQQ